MARVARRLDATLTTRPEPPLPAGVTVRGLGFGDGRPLGELMIAAYAGTVDDHGEPPGAALEEARHTLSGGYGPVEWPASLVAEAAGGWVGATVVTHDRGHLLLAFALVVPVWQGRGLGTALIVRSANRLAASGGSEWTLAVTEGNPAARLYERLGFRDHGSS